MLKILVPALLVLCATAAPSFAAETREAAQQLLRDGNYREAETIFCRLALDPVTPPKEAAESLHDALSCLTFYLNQPDEALRLADEAIAARPEEWRILAAAASAIADQQGIAELHRSLALQRLLAAEQYLRNAADPATADEQIAFYNQFERTLRIGRENARAWRLTALTDLSPAALPEAMNTASYWQFPARGAPVDENGDPVYYRVPASWDAATNDGERWRWLLNQMSRINDNGAATADWLFGEFLTAQFGVQTIAEGQGETGSFSVRTLGENETIARLGGGLKRFVMPDEFNHILTLRRAATSPAYRYPATALLATIFENRQQYPKAADLWRSLLADGRTDKTAEEALARITANSGALEPPPENGDPLSYLFRNGERVAFTAKRLNEKKLLADIRTTLHSNDSAFLENYLYRRPETLARFVFEKTGEPYIAETTAEWTLPLSPLPDHFSRRVDVDLPFATPGCYLIEAAMENGNTSRIVLWIADTALVRKDAFGQQMIFVADAATGEPVADADLTFTGITWQYDHKAGKQFYTTTEFADRTDADGLLFLPSEKLNNAEWLITATTTATTPATPGEPPARLAYLGFDPIWSSSPPPEDSTPERAFLLTDRPAYRPGQAVHFKAWIGRAAYTPRPGDSLAGRAVQITINNPRGDTVYDRTLTADAYGGVADSFTPDENAPLGHYSISLRANNIGGGASFRVEEYKKPEFEVSLDAPTTALPLGDSAQLKLRAEYYYGAPVTDARVAYTILRTPYAQRWTPPWRWDWLYGTQNWHGDIAPAGTDHRAPYMIPFRPAQPEIVAEGEGELDADGVFRFTLDTSPAKELFSHEDHEYRITFEVTDKSRRTIAGAGRVVATRAPFAVTVWTERGYHRAGEEITAEIKASLPLGGVVAANGKATLSRNETTVDEWDIATDPDGAATLRFRAAAAGQYKLTVSLSDGSNKPVSGETFLTVRGTPDEMTKADEGDFLFPALELTPDKREYRPGETLRLAVNSENRDGFVLLFPRAERGGAGATRPQIIRLKNGTHEESISVGRADQPNFFCEAITIFGGKVHSELREIFVPPADKTLQVKIESDKSSYRPGEKATFALAVTDAAGEPVAGQCTVSLYDKSVEYIAGGGNVGDIRAAFWSWRRFYNTNMTASLDKSSYTVDRDGDKPWQPVGVFGYEEADWNGDASYNTNALRSARPAVRQRMMKGGDEILMMEESTADMAVAAAPMAAMAMPMPAPAQEQAYAGGTATAADGGAAMAEVAVRSDFADTAFWTAALETDDDGRATFTVDMPENLTGWKARAWVMGMATRVGDGAREVTTTKNVIVRPQTPRFLTQTDKVVLSANLHNYLPRAKSARAELTLDGGLLEAAAGTRLVKIVELPANGEARVDWIIAAKRPGTATAVMKLLTDEESDAAEMQIPVTVHGARRVENFGTVLRPEESRRTFRFTVPEARLAEQSRLTFSFSASIAAQLLEALPYLIDYPYGCTEQTLNRFLPALTTRKFLDTLGLSLADAKTALAHSAENDDAQSAAWRTHWGDDRARLDRLPVFDDAELDTIVAQGTERLAGMQNADGGWGWFSGAGERSWPHTTAVVAHGLKTAAEAGAPLPAGILESGLQWLARYQTEQIAKLENNKDGDTAESKPRKAHADALDAFIHLNLAGTPHADPRMRTFLYRDRLELPLSALAMLGLALEGEGEPRAAELEMVLRNLSQFVETNEATHTAFLRTSGTAWWHWYNDDIETQTWYLKLLAKTQPRAEFTAAVAKHLLENRKNGSYWRSTRDTAYAVEALAAYAAASGEAAPDMTVKLYLDGVLVRERRLTRETLLADNTFTLESLAVESGDHELTIERINNGNGNDNGSGKNAGPLYCGGSLSLFSLEDPIPAAGGPELSVQRKFYKLTPAPRSAAAQTATGVAARIAAPNYVRAEINEFASGDLVEVELTVTAANDYEYLVFEDMKAAGLEAVELRSGYSGNSLGAYIEYRDEKVALFVRSLPRGEHRVAYRFRAEIPGAFSALPVFGGGMYATDLFCNSAEMKIRVVEEGTFE